MSVLRLFQEVWYSYFHDNSKNGIYYIDSHVQAKCQEIESFTCIVKNCKDIKREFPSLTLLKKHLKSSHNRVFCDICLKSNTNILSEQKLFKPSDLRHHLNKGELDHEGNIVLLHPYCCVGERFTI